jgi:hypothetical protein
LPINKIFLLILIIIAALIVPIFYLAILATNYLGILWPLMYLAIVLVLRYIIYKTGIDKTLTFSQRGIFGKARRVQITVGSGLLVAFGTVFAAKLIIGPLSAYFLIPFAILTIVGALIGDSIWRVLQNKHAENEK